MRDLKFEQVLPGESQGRGSLVGCCLWGRTVGHDWSDLAAAAASEEWMEESRCVQRPNGREEIVAQWDEMRKSWWWGQVTWGLVGHTRDLRLCCKSTGKPLKGCMQWVTNNWIYIFKRLLWLYVKCGLECSENRWITLSCNNGADSQNRLLS